jgi:hypothetical protein
MLEENRLTFMSSPSGRDPRKTRQEDPKGEELGELESKVRQHIKVVGRTLFCFRCDGSKEIASHYCACGSFLCTLHLAEHSCLVSASLQYNEELMHALC